MRKGRKIATSLIRPDGGDSKHARNVCKILADNMTQQPSKQPSSCYNCITYFYISCRRRMFSFFSIYHQIFFTGL